ncbi:MAG: hypothetical protein BIFFINMI_01862 [Phycisphaerae bacterium]|nr:hypothetical protein [Phycisphaerae bacterium]
MRQVAAIALTLCLACSATAGEATFTAGPTATRTGQGVRIDFAVSGPTDVAVFIQDAGGGIVRHLTAGVLKAEPDFDSPPPLRGGLTQSMVWDGRADYNGDPGPGPFQVRVALGLGATMDKVLIDSNSDLSNVQSLAVGGDGTLYVVAGAGGTGPVWSGQIMVALDRDGRYLRQIMPFPAGLSADQVKGFDVVELDGRPAPLVHNISNRSFYASSVPRKAGMAVTPDGVILTMVPGCNLGALDARGGAPWGRYVGPSLQPKVARARLTRRPFVAASSDGKWAFVSGLVDEKMDAKNMPRPNVANAVYRVPLPARSPAEPFFGDPAAAGADEIHLGGPPHGLACDGKGHLLIADTANGRVVVVNESDGKFVSQFKVEAGIPDPKAKGDKPRASDNDSGPDCVAVDRGGGAVYVTRLTGAGSVELIKYADISSGKAVARMPAGRSGNPDFPWLLAVDGSARPTVIWLGGDGGSLLRIEDAGDAFGKAVDVARHATGNAAFVDLSVDRVRDEVYTRCGMGSGSYWWFRVNDLTGQVDKVTLGPVPGAAGSQMVPAPDGSLYCPAYPYHILRFSREGKPMPWSTQTPYPKAGEEAGKGDKKFDVKAMPHGRYAPVSMTFLTHTIGVRHDGHVFVFEPAHPGDRPPKMLMEYDPQGNPVAGPIIWKVSDSAVGPKFDPQGNIYIAEQVRPLDQPYPPEFASIVGKVELQKTYLEGLKDSIPSMYGSIVKFSPRGGMIGVPGEDPWTAKFPDGPKLDPSLKTVEAASYHGHRNFPVKVTGALWMHMGISHVDMIACNCENTRFDVDEFGRVWYPDLVRFRVYVLDTNGHEIAHFGRYGNADTTDELSFSWLIGVAATDRHLYTGDSLNRRLLRAKLTYAVEKTVDVPK